MTPAELTSAGLLRLVRDARRDLAAMDERAEEARRGRTGRVDGIGPSDEQRAALLALALHHYYTAFETLLARVIRALEGELPDGADWHIALLEDAAQPLTPLRPALFSSEHLSPLGELRRFRHFLRNAYAVSLDVSRLEDLADVACRLHEPLRVDLARAIDFLESLMPSGSESSPG